MYKSTEKGTEESKSQISNLKVKEISAFIRKF